MSSSRYMFFPNPSNSAPGSTNLPPNASPAAAAAAANAVAAAVNAAGVSQYQNRNHIIQQNNSSSSPSTGSSATSKHPQIPGSHSQLHSHHHNSQQMHQHHHHHHSTQLVGHPSLSISLLNSKREPAYTPQVEAISPTLPNEDIPLKEINSKSKDEQALLVEKLKKVDGDIARTEKQIQLLRNKKQQLEYQASKDQEKSRKDKNSNQEAVGETKLLSIAKLIYLENRTKARKSHSMLEHLGCVTKDLPVYNQPYDHPIVHYNAAKFSFFKKTLIANLKSKYTIRAALEETISSEYDTRMQKWLDTIERIDSQPQKRLKDAKLREFFEKQFPELKKQRELGERFTRVGQRVARNDAELEEIIDGISEREAEDKRIKSYAVIPPILEEIRCKKPKYINENGFVEDLLTEYKEYQQQNTWTDEERETFKDNYLLQPKNFGFIASMIERKTVSNCVQYYYLSKKSENFKHLIKRQQKRRTRSFVKPNHEANKSNGTTSTEKQGGDSNGGNNKVADASNEPSIKEPIEQDIVMKVEVQQSSSTCCICECNFSEENQSRNVTRSNHQLYGISMAHFKPGMQICYSCRFRHVKHPSFDEQSKSPLPDENDLDAQVVQNVQGDAQAQQRTCLRDIIYQAIEMSFQDSKPLDLSVIRNK